MLYVGRVGTAIGVACIMAAAVFFSLSRPKETKLHSMYHQTNTNCPEAHDVDLQMQHWQEETWSNASDKDKMCEAFHSICIDQGQFLYKHKDGQPPPFFNLTAGRDNLRQSYVVETLTPGEGKIPQDFRVPDPVFLPLTPQETSPALMNPVFSNCTVPVVWFASYLSNFGETFERFLVLLWAARKKGAWDTRYNLLFNTQKIPHHLSLMSRVHSQFEARTLSEASASSKCFQTLVMCKIPGEWHWTGRVDMNTGYWEMNKGFERPNWDAAKSFLDFYRKTGQLPAIDLSDLPKSINTTSRDNRKEKEGRRLRVVIALRPHASRRTILNIDETMDWCNSWRPSSQSSAFTGADCIAYSFDELLLSAALMEHTDILIGVHGAAVVNAMFMPLGSSVIEIRPLEFAGLWPNHYLRKMLTVTDHNSSVFWWGLNIKNRTNSAKGEEEQLGGSMGNSWTWTRDRHVRIELRMIERMFDEILKVNRDAKRYQETASQGQHYIDDLGQPATDWVDGELLSNHNYMVWRYSRRKNSSLPPGCPNYYNIATIKCP